MISYQQINFIYHNNAFLIATRLSNEVVDDKFLLKSIDNLINVFIEEFPGIIIHEISEINEINELTMKQYHLIEFPELEIYVFTEDLKLLLLLEYKIFQCYLRFPKVSNLIDILKLDIDGQTICLQDARYVRMIDKEELYTFTGESEGVMTNFYFKHDIIKFLKSKFQHKGEDNTLIDAFLVNVISEFHQSLFSSSITLKEKHGKFRYNRFGEYLRLFLKIENDTFTILLDNAENFIEGLHQYILKNKQRDNNLNLMNTLFTFNCFCNEGTISYDELINLEKGDVILFNIQNNVVICDIFNLLYEFKLEGNYLVFQGHRPEIINNYEILKS